MVLKSFIVQAKLLQCFAGINVIKWLDMNQMLNNRLDRLKLEEGRAAYSTKSFTLVIYNGVSVTRKFRPIFGKKWPNNAKVSTLKLDLKGQNI